MEDGQMMWVVEDGRDAPTLTSVREGKTLDDGNRYVYFDAVVRNGCLVKRVAQRGVGCWEKESDAWEYMVRLRRAGASMALNLVDVAEAKMALAVERETETDDA